MVIRVAYKRKGAKWKELTDAVTYFIAKDLPRTFDPRYELPAWKMAANRVKAI